MDGEPSKIEPVTAKRKPPRAGMGRPKGTQNLITRTLKEALEESFNRLGGVEWLLKLAETDPGTYARLLIKLLPTKIDAEVNYAELTDEQRLARFDALLERARARRIGSNPGSDA
ncbi:hypothetical protein [Acidihalobacter aeolianus]|nr:hypothetical protein [Acidihalobacter aeolianus]